MSVLGLPDSEEKKQFVKGCKELESIRFPASFARKIVTMSDGNASFEVKLWGTLSETSVHEGSSVAMTCLHVDVYQGKRSLNSSGGTEIQNVDNEETFAGFIQAASFDHKEVPLENVVNALILDEEPKKE